VKKGVTELSNVTEGLFENKKTVTFAVRPKLYMKKTFVCVITAVLLATIPSFSQLSFLNPKYPADEWTSYSLVSGDFDGNHLIDFAYISEDLKLHTLYQKSDHSFRKVDVIVSQASLSSYTLESGDLNKDGLTDLVLFDMTAPTSTQKLVLYISQGETFSKSLVSTAPALLSKDIEIADLNADGHTDVILATDNNMIVVYEGNSTSTFTAKTITANEPIYMLKAADINNDNKIDIVAANYAQELLIYRAAVDGTFALTKQTIGTPVVGMAVGDLNNDNLPEIIINSSGSAPIKYFKNDGAGVFSSSDLSGFSQTYGAVIIVDYDKDGLKDILAAGGLSAPIVALKNTGNHQFAQVPVPGQVGNISSLIGVDYDQNGSIEIVALSLGKRLDVYSYNTLFSYQGGVLLGTSPSCSKVADLNKDGYSDIITGSGVSNSITILYGDADFSYSKRVNHLFSFQVRNVAINDFNSDGYPDVAFSAAASGSDFKTGVYLSEMNGILKDQYVTVDNYSSGLLETADVNKDGKADIITDMSIFLGDGTGSFTPTSFYPPFSAFTSAIGDLNLDGYPDLVISDGNSTLKFSLNDQTGNFNSFNLIPTTRPNHEITIELVNNDSYPDIVVAHNNSSKVLSIFTNQQNGTFVGSEIDLSPTEFPRAIFKDLDNDGLKDIVANGYYDWKIFLQDGVGNFVYNQTIPLAQDTYPYQVFAQDINSDSKIDLVGISANGNPVSVIINDMVTEPSVKTSSLSVSKRTSNSATVTITPGNGKSRLILIREAADVDATPVDGMLYNAKLSFGDGTMIGSQSYAVHSGTGLEINVEKLKPNTAYVVSSYEYNINEKNNIINYNQSATTISFTTKTIQAINPRTDLTLTGDSAPSTISISATSNLPVALQKISGNISVAGDIITILGPGPVQVSASQAGNDVYDQAPTTTLSFCINPPIPTIKIEEISSPFEFHLISSSATHNQWYYNEQIVPAETSQVYVPKKNGVFAVKVDYSGCSSTSAKTSFIYTGLEESAPAKINIYPNPTTSIVNIDTTVPLDDVKVVDNLGREIHPNIFDHAVDFTSLENGIYFLLIRTNTGVAIKKVIRM
jgi:hypothetical protein